MRTVASTSTARPSRRRGQPASRLGGRRAVLLAGCVLGLAVLFVVNWLYQVVRKPAEVFAPLSTTLSKSPRATWETYGPLFEAHSTDIMTPELLAALAQVEGQGNPLARTYWRWRFSLNPFEIYRPASTAVGMLQITDGTFATARKYCIHDHQVVSDGPWHDFGSCWFNSLYTRVLPSHAIELTAAYLHQTVVDIVARRRSAKASLQQRQDLAAVIHLCGATRGEAFVGRRFRVAPAERCGDHDVREYLGRVNLLKRQFARLRAA